MSARSPVKTSPLARAPRTPGTRQRKKKKRPNEVALVVPAASPPRSLTAIQKATHSPLKANVWTIWYAAQYGKVARVRSLLDRQAVTSVDVQELRTRWSALHFAARYGHDELVQLLLERGADPDLRDMMGNTPLHLSAGWGSLRCTVLLLENGAQSSLANHSGETPLAVAKKLARHEQLKVLGSWQPLGLTPEELLQRRRSSVIDPSAVLIAALQRLQLEIQDETDPRVRQELHALCAKTQEHGEHHESILTTLDRLVAAYRSTDRLEKALETTERAMALAESLYGQQDIVTVTWLANAGELLFALHRWHESEQYLEQAHEELERLLGGLHHSTLAVLESLAIMSVTKKDSTLAESLLRELLQRLDQVYEGGWNERVFQLNLRLGVSILEQKRVLEAQRVFERCHAHTSDVHGEKHPHTVMCIEQLGRCAFVLGNFEHAEHLFLQALRLSLVQGGATTAAQHRRLHNNLAMLAIARKSEAAVRDHLQHHEHYVSETIDADVVPEDAYRSLV